MCGSFQQKALRGKGEPQLKPFGKVCNTAFGFQAALSAYQFSQQFLLLVIQPLAQFVA